MRMWWLGIALALAFACGGQEPSAPAARAGPGRLESRPCWFEPDEDTELRVECAELHVPERWDAPDVAREVVIPVVVLRAADEKRWATLIPGGGGPGGSVGLESD